MSRTDVSPMSEAGQSIGHFGGTYVQTTLMDRPRHRSVEVSSVDGGRPADSDDDRVLFGLPGVVAAWTPHDVVAGPLQDDRSNLNGAVDRTLSGGWMKLPNSQPRFTARRPSPQAYVHEWPDVLDRTRSLVDSANETAVTPARSRA